MIGLDELRKRIDKLDDNILEALTSRIEIVKEIGLAKRRLKMSVHDPKRETKIANRVKRMAEAAGVDPIEISHIYQHIFSLCRKAQGDEYRAAYLGPRGTFCEQAARAYFEAKPATLVEKDSIKEVFRSVSAGETGYGIVPVENSIEGSVNIALDMLLESDCMVFG
ncbi:MAG: prephenate dehydratase, partial [Nitrososphaeria archaeon]|nr:prephenate dehydratase [Nitrososphaeria archaeon]